MYNDFQAQSFWLHFCLQNELYRVRVTHISDIHYRVEATNCDVVITLKAKLISGEVHQGYVNLWAAAIWLDRHSGLENLGDSMAPAPAGNDYLAAAKIKRPKI